MKLSRMQIRRLIESVINEDETKSSSSIASTKSEIENQFNSLKSGIKNNPSDLAILSQFEQALFSYSKKMYENHLEAVFKADGARNQENVLKTIDNVVKKFINIAMKAKKPEVQESLLGALENALIAANAQQEMNKSTMEKMVKNFKIDPNFDDSQEIDTESLKNIKDK